MTEILYQRDLSEINTRGHVLSNRTGPFPVDIVVTQIRGVDWIRCFDLPNLCIVCGERTSRLIGKTASDDFYIDIEPCQFSEGLPASVVQVAIPSGKMVIDDSIRAPFFRQVDADPDLGSVAGKHALALAYADVGVGYGFVSNTCPSILRVKETGDILFGDFYDPEYGECFVPEGYESLGGVITDLWAVCFMDYEKFLKCGGREDRGTTIIDVEPGVYEFEHYAHCSEFDFDNYMAPSTVYGKVKKV